MHERNTCKIRGDSTNESVANGAVASLLFSTGERGVRNVSERMRDRSARR
jgi:hypothetical protein